MKLMIPSVKEPSDEICRGRTNQFCWFVSENKEEKDEKEIRDKGKWKNADEKARILQNSKLPLMGWEALGGEDDKTEKIRVKFKFYLSLFFSVFYNFYFLVKKKSITKINI